MIDTLVYAKWQLQCEKCTHYTSICLSVYCIYSWWEMTISGKMYVFKMTLWTEACVCFISAGGTGVLLNVDHVAELLKSLGHNSIQVRGLADSGWFLDNKQYRCTDCVDTIGCAPTEAIKRGIRWGVGGGHEGKQMVTKAGFLMVFCVVGTGAVLYLSAADWLT